MKRAEPFVPVSNTPRSVQDAVIAGARRIDQEEFGGADKLRFTADEPRVRGWMAR